MLLHPVALCLTNDQCWELLKKKVFGNQPCPPELQGNCSQLRRTTAFSGCYFWVTFKSGHGRKYMGRNNSVMQILKLSYMHLPQHLKPCFLYFGAFQKAKERNSCGEFYEVVGR
ncbi:hypothetical protein ACS0TY_033686 [Phlomoides rotata]